jgi:orotate phosphoribosyltransferase
MAGSAKHARLVELLKERAVKRGKFTLRSGAVSDFYIDGRSVTLHPEGASLVADLVLESIRDDSVDAVGGPTLGADPIVGAVVARSHEAGRPVRGFIVRKEPKDHGTGKVLEGEIEPGTRAAVVEDTTTRGGMVIHSIEALRAAGAEVVRVVAIVDRESGAREAVESLGIPFTTLVTLAELGLGG